MNSVELQKQKLVEEINLGLEQQGSLIPVLRKAIRLAKLCQELEYQSLFEIHLDGVSPVAGVRTQKWPDQVKPKWNYVKALFEDRAVDKENLQGFSVEKLEAVLGEAKELRNSASKSESIVAAMNTAFEIREVLNRIRNRVGMFVLEVEHSVSISPEPRTGVVSKSILEGRRVFLGHGRSGLWKDLKDFLADRLGLPWDEFNRESVAGKSNKERLEQMLDNACFAFIVMTAEDEHADKTMHARENVIHEIGLFQGRLGFSKAIVLLEDGCEEFSNINGLTQIRFPKGNILAKSEEIRRVLEREGIIKHDANH
jgi:predicted nucleotide-binding protein